jgi:hypothetical protein
MPFFLPGIAVIVVAGLLPGAWLICGYELDGPDPLGTLPRVQPRHHQSQRPAVLGGQRLSVVAISEQHVLGHEFSERQVGGVAFVVTVCDDKMSVRLEAAG